MNNVQLVDSLKRIILSMLAMTHEERVKLADAATDIANDSAFFARVTMYSASGYPTDNLVADKIFSALVADVSIPSKQYQPEVPIIQEIIDLNAVTTTTVNTNPTSEADAAADVLNAFEG